MFHSFNCVALAALLVFLNVLPDCAAWPLSTYWDAAWDAYRQWDGEVAHTQHIPSDPRLVQRAHIQLTKSVVPDFVGYHADVFAHSEYLDALRLTIVRVFGAPLDTESPRFHEVEQSAAERCQAEFGIDAHGNVYRRRANCVNCYQLSSTKYLSRFPANFASPVYEISEEETFVGTTGVLHNSKKVLGCVTLFAPHRRYWRASLLSSGGTLQGSVWFATMNGRTDKRKFTRVLIDVRGNGRNEGDQQCLEWSLFRDCQDAAVHRQRTTVAQGTFAVADGRTSESIQDNEEKKLLALFGEDPKLKGVQMRNLSLAIRRIECGGIDTRLTSAERNAHDAISAARSMAASELHFEFCVSVDEVHFNADAEETKSDD